MPYGIPSHNTFGEVYAAIDTDHFIDCFSRWVADLASITEGEVAAVDGKRLRRSLDKASKKAAIYMASAWAQQNKLWFWPRLRSMTNRMESPAFPSYCHGLT
jgi:hypothetical protein